ncbi:hypothetical protein D3C87_2075220 [compost metagenome]
MFFNHAPLGATEFYGPTACQPSLLIEQTHPGDLVFFVETLSLATTRRDVGRQCVVQKRAHFLAEGLFGRGELDIH